MPSLARWAVRMVASPPRGLATPGLLGGRLVAITDDNTGVAPALADELRRHGVNATVGRNELTNATTVICLEGLRALTVDEAELMAQAEQIHLDVFHTARSVAKRFSAQAGTFITVQDTGGDFGLSGTPRAWLAGPAALARTAAVEWPNAIVRAIDIERAERNPQQLAAALAQELLGGAPEREVGLRANTGRARVILEPAPLAVQSQQWNDEDPGFVVASGGARGVTAACLVQLTRTGAARILLLGRTPLAVEPPACAHAKTEAELKRALALAAREAGQAIDLAAIGREANQILAVREIVANVTRLRQMGNDVHYAVVDASDAQAVAQAIAERRSHWGPVTALVHGAGVLADKLIADKTDAQFLRVTRTKVEGLRALLTATRDDPLRLMLLFSSVAARSGNLGQCDYAMANEVLNKVAALEQNRRGDACIVRALGWGPWDAGMVDDGLRARFAAMGVSLISLAAGVEAFVRECGSRTPAAEIILGGDNEAKGLAGPEAGQTFVCEIAVNSQTHGYLDGHRIKGVPVVPMALVLEWFARAAQAAYPDLRLWRLGDVKVLRGLRLPGFDESGSEVVRVTARPLANGGHTSLAMELLAGDGARLYAATCELRDYASLPDHVVSIPTNLPPLRRPIYGEAPLFHGPSFHMLRSLDGKDVSTLVATVTGASDRNWPASTSGDGVTWHIDAAIVDAGLQLALLWTHEALGGVSLPTGLESLRVYGQGAAISALHAVLHARHSSGVRCVVDVTFLDAAGNLFLELRGVETHVIATTNSSATSVSTLASA